MQKLLWEWHNFVLACLARLACSFAATVNMQITCRHHTALGDNKYWLCYANTLPGIKGGGGAYNSVVSFSAHIGGKQLGEWPIPFQERMSRRRQQRSVQLVKTCSSPSHLLVYNNFIPYMEDLCGTTMAAQRPICISHLLSSVSQSLQLRT